MDEPCISCGRPDKLNLFRPGRRPEPARDEDVREPSSLASLDPERRGRTIHAALNPPNALTQVSIAVHRFEELIGGHPYLIEVAAVATDRWRACIVRIPGGPIALMPFYGPTPDDAASRLRQWLTRAHELAPRGMVTAVLASENPREGV